MEEIAIILVLILLNGLFAMSEIALVSARKSSLKAEASKGSKAARRALALQENPDRFLSSVQVGITLVGLLTGMFSGNKVAAICTTLLTDAGLEPRLASGLAQMLIIIVVTYLSIVIGELVPKRIGMNSAERVAKLVAGPMSFMSRLTKPLVWILAKSTSAIAINKFQARDGCNVRPFVSSSHPRDRMSRERWFPRGTVSSLDDVLLVYDGKMMKTREFERMVAKENDQ